MKNEKGSILVLTLISILILSLMVLGLLTVGSTETATTQNYHLSRIAYYTAMQGVEDLRAEMMTDTNSGESWEDNYRKLEDTKLEESFGLITSYMSGSLPDLESYESALSSDPHGDHEIPTVSEFHGFDAPPMPGTDFKIVGTGEITPFLVQVQVTAKARMGGQTAYSEIIAVIYYTDFD